MVVVDYISHQDLIDPKNILKRAIIAPTDASKTISEDLQNKAIQLDKAIDNSFAISTDNNNVISSNGIDEAKSVAVSKDSTPVNTSVIEVENAPITVNANTTPITNIQSSNETLVDAKTNQNVAENTVNEQSSEAANFDEMVRLLKEQQEQREKLKTKRESQYTSVLKSILKPADTISSVDLPEANLSQSKVYQELTQKQTTDNVNYDLIYAVRDYIKKIKAIAHNHHENLQSQNKRSAASDIEGMAALIGDLSGENKKVIEEQNHQNFMSAISSLPSFDKDGNIVATPINQTPTPIEEVPFELTEQKEESEIDEKLRLAQEAAMAQLEADKELNDKLKEQAYQSNSKLTINDVEKVQIESEAPIDQLPPSEQSDFVELQDVKVASFDETSQNTAIVNNNDVIKPSSTDVVSTTEDAVKTNVANTIVEPQVAPVATEIKSPQLDASSLGTPLSLVLAKLHQLPEKVQGAPSFIVESTYPNSLKIVLEKARHGNFGNARNIADPMSEVVPSERLNKELEALYDYEAKKVAPVNVAPKPTKQCAPSYEQKSFVAPVQNNATSVLEQQVVAPSVNHVAKAPIQEVSVNQNQITTPQTFNSEMGVVKVQNKPTEQRSIDEIKADSQKQVIESQAQEPTDAYEEIEVETVGDDAHIYNVEDDDGDSTHFTPVNADALSFGNENENSLSDGDPKVMRESTLKLLDEDQQFENRRLGRKLESRDFYHLVEKSDDWFKLIHQAGYNFGDYYASLCFSSRLIDPNDQYRWILKISDDFALLMKQPDFHHNLVTKFSICMHHPVDITFAPVKGIPEGSPEDLARKFYLKEIATERDKLIHNPDLCEFIKTLGDDPRTVNLGLYTQQVALPQDTTKQQ